MDEQCVAESGEHVKEYYETRNGETWEKCRNCGNLFFLRYDDCGSGG